MWQIPKLIIVAYEKIFIAPNYYYYKVLLFKMKYVLDGGCLYDYRHIQYTRVKWDFQGTEKVSPTQQISQFTKRGENDPLIKSFLVN